MSFLTPVNRRRRGVANELIGIYRGVVEYNLDPLSLGRCKVRIPNIHSTEKSIETSDLPWAEPVPLYGGFHDGGSFLVPPVGSTVRIMFEMGDPQHPVYFGTWYKNPTEPREINTKTSRETGKLLPSRPISMGTWKQPIGPELPKELMQAPYYDPTLKILIKSQKGHTIMVDDLDGSEKLELIDRTGQTLSMVGGVTIGDNLANKEQRGLRKVKDGDALSYDKLIGKTATIDLLGSSGQGFRIISSPNAESIEIVSKDDSQVNTPNGGKNKLSVTIGGSLGYLEIVGVTENQETIRINIDTRTGSIDIKGQGTTSILSDMITLSGEQIYLHGDVSINGDLSVGGDAMISKQLIGGQ